MLNFRLAETSRVLDNLLAPSQSNGLNLQTSSIEEKVRLLILRDLLRLNWKFEAKNQEISLVPPSEYSKEVVRNSMSFRRAELIDKNASFIVGMEAKAKRYLANGVELLNAKIEPFVEVCTTEEQNNLFRYFRYFWSSPASEYVGRRIRILVRDRSIPGYPVIGIAALGSSIIHIPERDDWVGWDVEERTQNIIYTMDAYVLGALPPYNYFLGGKLISYILASNEIRNIFMNKYRNQVTQIKKRKANRLACIFTTSLFGKSSIYNRINFREELLYKPIGYTKGYGTLHLSSETFSAMKDLIEEKSLGINNRFGDGPSWTMRVIRTVGDLLNFDSDFLLQHSFKREIYALPLASNALPFLRNEHKKLNYLNYELQDLVQFWKTRWLEKRKNNPDAFNQVSSFKADNFSIV